MGCGVGLRTQHYPWITEHWPAIEWFEAISENYMDSGGRPLAILEKIRQRYPVALHGTSLSIGSKDPLNPLYLERLKGLVERVDPFIVSDHLCWTGVDGQQLYDLLPLPFTEEAVRHIAGRITQVQDILGRNILIENVSTYVTYKHSVMPEWEFLSEIARRSGCGILLDLNNIYVNSKNHGFDAVDYLRGVPGSRVGQFHLAGHTDMGAYLFDTHSAEVIEPVWELYRQALAMYGPVSTLIEWDEHIPDFPGLEKEAAKARVIYRQFVKDRKSEQHENSCVPAVSPNAAGPSLVDVQRRFLTNIYPGVPADASLGDILNPQGGDPGFKRVKVYAGGYPARIREALSDVYAAVQKVLGESAFSQLATDYACHYPSHHYNLNHSGQRLAEFLETWPPGKELPFLSDLAHLESQVSRAFHAFEKSSFDPAKLQALAPEDWERARLVFQPSFGMISSGWPVLDIWRARKLPPEEIKIDLQGKPQWILIFRQGVEVYTHEIDREQYNFLQGLKNGKSLGDVCGEFAEAGGELPLQQWFASWVQSGFIASCEVRGLKILN